MLVIAFESVGLIIYRILRDYGTINIGKLFGNYLEILRFMIGALIFAFCLFLIVTGSRLQRLLGHARWLQKFGKISYSFYLIHHVLLSKVDILAKICDMNKILISVFVFSTSIVVASIMYWGIEVKLGKILRKSMRVV